MIAFLSQYWSTIATLTLEHLWLTAAAMFLATAIAVPLGVWLTRAPQWAKPVLAVTNILQTIPSLAMFGFLLPVPWLGERVARIAILALTAYALLPILRNTYTGICEIDPSITEVAQALGLTDLQRLFKVELPLAASFILAGLRTATVTCIGIATIAAAVGAGGLGELIFRGVASVDNRLVLAGAIPAALLALAADGALGLLERRLKVRAMIQTRFAAAIASALCLLLVGCAPPRPDHPVIGAKNFTEQVVLGELLAQEIEAKSNLKVERRFYLAGSYICHQALISGRIDGYVEYTGTALTAILKQPLDRDPQAVLDTVRRLYASRYNVVVGPPLGFQNTFAMVIRGEDARRLHLATLSQAAQYTPHWQLGVGYEFEQRPDGLPGLSAAYGLEFAGPPRAMELGLLYRALNAHQVDMIAANSTDGPIRAFGLTVLQDDKHYFPPYQAVPLIRKDSLKRWPQIQLALNALAGKITEDDMRGMNEQVDGEHRDPAIVVREFRAGKGL